MVLIRRKLKRKIKVPGNPVFNLSQIKREIETQLRELRIELTDRITKEIENIADRINQKEPANAGFIEKIVSRIVADIVRKTKGDKGESGEKGEKGEKGRTGDTGIPGLQGEKGRPGESKIPGPPGMEGEKGERGIPGPPGMEGEKGEDGSLISPQDIARKLESLTGEQKLDAKAIKNLPMELAGRKVLHRGGIQLTWTELLGTGDGTTKIFTLTKAPKSTSSLLMAVGGGLQFLTDDFTISGKTITFITAPPLNAKVRALIFQSS